MESMQYVTVRKTVTSNIELLIDDIFRVLLRCNDVSVVVLQQHNHWMNPSNGRVRGTAKSVGMRMLDLRADPQR